MLTAIVVLSVMGIIISLYGIMVEKNIANNQQYKPSCDISDTVSCTRAFLSPYSKMFGVSIVWAALFFYSTLLAFALAECIGVVIALCIFGLAVTMAFAYVLYFKVRTVCLICTSLYIVDIALAVAAYCLMVHY